MVDGGPISGGSVNPDAVSKLMSRYMRKLCWKSWAREHNVDEMNDDSWFQPVVTIIKNTCTTIWTKTHVDMARSWVASGAVTQARIYVFGWTTDGKCQKCDIFRREVHCLYECRYWRRIRNDLTDEVRMFEQIAKICCFPQKLNDVWRCEQRLVPHYFVSYGPEVWKRMPYRYEGKIAVRGSLRRVAVKYDPCGWAVVQLDIDGGDMSEYRMYGIILGWDGSSRA